MTDESLPPWFGVAVARRAFWPWFSFPIFIARYFGASLPLSGLSLSVSVLALPSRPSRVAVAPVAHIYTTMPPRRTVFSLTLYTIEE